MTPLKGALKALVAASLVLPMLAYAQGTLRLGISLRMLDSTGQQLGKMLQDEVAAVNAAGGINGIKIETVLMNDECSPAKAVPIANQLVYQNRIHVYFAPTCSSAALPANEIASKEGVPTLVPSAVDDRITKTGSPWIFRVAISQRFYKGVYGKFIGEKLGKKVAYLATNEPVSDNFITTILEYMKSTYSAEPAIVVRVQAGETDYRSALLRIAGVKPDALVFIGSQHADSARILQQANEVGLDKKIARVGATGMSNASAPQLAGEDIVGVYFATGFDFNDARPEVQAFVKKIRSKYDIYAPDHDFSQNQDALGILFQALRRANVKLNDASLADDRRAIRDAIAAIGDYKGLAARPIGFCAEATAECRDGNRTIVFAQYTKGGKEYAWKQVDAVNLPKDFGLK